MKITDQGFQNFLLCLLVIGIIVTGYLTFDYFKEVKKVKAGRDLYGFRTAESATNLTTGGRIYFFASKLGRINITDTSLVKPSRYFMESDGMYDKRFYQLGDSLVAFINEPNNANQTACIDFHKIIEIQNGATSYSYEFGSNPIRVICRGKDLGYGEDVLRDYKGRPLLEPEFGTDAYRVLLGRYYCRLLERELMRNAIGIE